MSYQNPLETEWLTTQDITIVPARGVVPSRDDVKIEPFIYSAPMDTVTGYDLTKALLGLGETVVVSRFIPEQEKNLCIRDFANNPCCFFAVGLNGFSDFLMQVADVAEANGWEELPKLNVAIDIAHGDMEAAHKLASYLRNDVDSINYVMSGSICTSGAALEAVESGCTHLRVGVGPGAACTTRLMTGVGLPNLTAVYRIDKALKKFINWRNEITIIADGGIRYPGDAFKYLSAGADAVMLGRAFTMTRESAGWVGDLKFPEPGEIMEFPRPEPELKLVKTYRGQASAEFQHSVFGQENACPEGVASDAFEWDGETTVKRVVDNYRGGIRSGLSYVGLCKMSELKTKPPQFMKVTPAGYAEGTPHGVQHVYY